MDISNLALVISMSIFRTDNSPVSGQVQDAKVDTALKASVVELLIKNADAICKYIKQLYLLVLK